VAGEDGAHAGVAGIAAGEEGGARGRADGRVGVPLREANAVRGEAVEVRRAEVGLAHAGEVAAALVVGEEDEDVGLGHAGLGILDSRFQILDCRVQVLDGHE